MLPVSKDTLLRVVRRRSRPPPDPLRGIGINDWAWRRNHRYASIVCNLERRRITLLPDREPATAQARLAAHPTIAIVARDRGGGYGEAAAKALPHAIQVADRWHLMENASFVLITAGSLLTLPSNLVSGLYRARGLYGRAVQLQNWGMLFAQIAQLAATVATGSLLAVTANYIAAQVLSWPTFWRSTLPACFRFCGECGRRIHGAGLPGSFARRLRLPWRAPSSSHWSICQCCWSALLCPTWYIPD
jgi:hypothetical protein